ncbi:hypothetical protein MBLNU457_1677t1 [Dothideomycetes sp. NU457]
MESMPPHPARNISPESSLDDTSTGTSSNTSPRSSQHVDDSTESSTADTEDQISKTSPTKEPLDNEYVSEYVSEYRKQIRKNQLLGTRCRARTVANDLRGNLSLDIEIIADSADDEDRKCWHQRKYRERLKELYGLSLYRAQVWVKSPTLVRLANYRADARLRREMDVVVADAWLVRYANAESEKEKRVVMTRIEEFLASA